MILLDLNMPRSGGLSILQQLRSSPKLTDIPVGILTGSQSSSDAQRALTMGAARYIPKATDYDTFVSNVSRAVVAMLDARELKTQRPRRVLERTIPAMPRVARAGTNHK